MIRINLLPSKEAQLALGKRNQRSLVILGVLVLALVMVVPYLSQGRRMATLDRQAEETRRQIARYNEQVKEVERLDRLRDELETKLQIIEDLNDKRVGPARMLADLSVATPEKMWLLEFKEAGANATLTGMALDNETIADFMRQLQASPYFTGVDLVEATVSTDRQLAGFKRFIIKAGIDYFGRGGAAAPAEAAAPEAPGGGQRK